MVAEEIEPMAAAATVSVDEFQALEQKVLQTVELIKMERASRAAFEAEAVTARAETAAAEARTAEANAKLAELNDRLAERDTLIAALRGQLEDAGTGAQQELQALHREREATRQRVGKMLADLDELL